MRSVTFPHLERLVAASAKTTAPDGAAGSGRRAGSSPRPVELPRAAPPDGCAVSGRRPRETASTRSRGASRRWPLPHGHRPHGGDAASSRDATRRRSLLVLSVAAVFLTLPAAAHAAGLTSEIDRNQAHVGDQLVLTLTVEGTQRGRPELGPLPDFDVYPRGSSTQVQMINGRFSASVVYTYILVPHRTGSFTVGAATVSIDGKTYSSRPFTVRVLAAEEKPEASRDLFVTTRVSNRHPYVGEQVIFTLRIYQRVPLAQANLHQLEFDGFTAQDLGKERTYDTTLDGAHYRVTELSKAIFPQEVGKHATPTVALDCQVVVRRRRPSGFDDFFDNDFDSFFGHADTRPVTVRGAPVEVDVRALPPAPPGFGGLVGQFDVSATLSNRQPKVGDSTTLTVTVSGKGNAQSIPEPLVDGIEGRFKVYDDKPTATLDAGRGGVSGSKTFVKALVPLVAGELRIPPIRVVYFDPDHGAYRTASTQPLTLTALPGAKKEDLRLTELVAPEGGKVAVKVLADDILPLYGKLDALSVHRLSAVGRLLFAAGLVIPALVFFALLLVLRRRERLASDVWLRRKRVAGRRARAGLAEVARYSRSGQLERASEATSRTLREYVGDQLNLEGGALTPQETAAHLAAAGVEEPLIEQVRELLADCEAMQYGGEPSGAAAAGGELSAVLGRMIKDLGRRLDRAGGAGRGRTGSEEHAA